MKLLPLGSPNASTVAIYRIRGEQGCLTYQRGGAMRKIPAFTKTVVDTMGEGDASSP